MKWIAALLLIANVAVYLLASGRQLTVDESENVSKPDVNKEGMLLVSETDLAGAAVNTASPEPESEDGRQATRAAAGACYRIGPFKNEAGWAAAKQWIEDSGIGYRHVSSSTREFHAIRVYLGPYNTESSVETMIHQLESRELNHFVYQVGDGMVRISLGYFTQQELAEKFLDHLESIGVEAKSEPDYWSLGPYHWMEIPAEEIEQSRLSDRDWNEPSVALSKVKC